NRRGISTCLIRSIAPESSTSARKIPFSSERPMAKRSKSSSISLSSLFAMPPVKSKASYTMALKSPHRSLRQAVEASEQRLRLSQAAAGIGSWEWDPVHLAVLSDELHSIFGTHQDDTLFTQWRSRVHPEDQERVFRLMDEGYRSGEIDFEYRFLHPQNGLRWFRSKGRRMANQERMF